MHLVRALNNQNAEVSTLNYKFIKSLSNCAQHVVKTSFYKLVLKMNIPLPLLKTILPDENRGGYISVNGSWNHIILT